MPPNYASLPFCLHINRNNPRYVGMLLTYENSLKEILIYELHRPSITNREELLHICYWYTMLLIYVNQYISTLGILCYLDNTLMNQYISTHGILCYLDNTMMNQYISTHGILCYLDNTMMNHYISTHGILCYLDTKWVGTYIANDILCYLMKTWWIVIYLIMIFYTTMNGYITAHGMV